MNTRRSPYNLRHAGAICSLGRKTLLPGKITYDLELRPGQSVQEAIKGLRAGGKLLLGKGTHISGKLR